MKIITWFQNNKEKTLRVIELFLVCLAVTSLFGNNALNEDNFNYGIEEMHAYNHSLYSDNINVVGATHSPRLVANVFMVGLMKVCGGNWNTAAMYLIRVNILLYAVAFTFVSYKLFKGNRVLGGIIISTTCMCGSLISLAFAINVSFDVFLGTAIPLAMIAIISILGEKQYWNIAWIMLALAEFMHVHEGIWAGSIIGLIWMTDCIIEKKILWNRLKTLPIYIMSVLLVVIPSLLHTEAVDNRLFNKIYVFIRTPHHLLLSYWGAAEIIMSGVMIAAVIWIYALSYAGKANSQNKRDSICNVVLFMWWIILLAVEYFSTEVLTVSTVITMYVPKCFKYITWLASLIYAKIGINDIENQNYIQGISLMAILMIPNILGGRGVYVSFAVLVIIYFISRKYQLDKKVFLKSDNGMRIFLTYLIIGLIIFFRLYFSIGKYKAISALLILAVVLYIVFVKDKIKRQNLGNALTITGLIFSMILSTANFIYSIDRGGISYISGNDYTKNAVGQDIYELAKEYEQLTDLDDMFLADPDDSASNGFQLVSHRSCYALYKNTPSDKNSVIEWFKRIERVRTMTTCSADELRKLMYDTECEYVLVQADRFEILEESNFFISIAKNDFYGVYKVKS